MPLLLCLLKWVYNMLKPNVRELFTITLNGQGTKSEDLPKDIVCGAALDILGYGYIVAGFASGTPVAKYGSGMNTLVESFKLSRRGDTFKNISPEMLRFENLLINKNAPLFRATASATATDNPLTDANLLAYGTDTQKLNWREKMTMHLCYPHAADESQYFKTALRTTNVSRTVFEVVQQPYTNIRAYGNTCDVTYSGDVLKIRVDLLEYEGDEAAALPCAWDYRQEEIPVTFESATTKTVKAPQLGLLSSIIICARDGHAGAAGAGTGKAFNDNTITNVELIINKRQYVVSTFYRLKDIMKDLFGYAAPKSSSVAIDDGFSGIFFTKNGFRDLVDISQEAATNCDLKLTSGAVTYTAIADVKVLFNQVAPIAKAG